MNKDDIKVGAQFGNLVVVKSNATPPKWRMKYNRLKRLTPWYKATNKRRIDKQVAAINSHDNTAWYKLMSNPFA